MKHVRRVLVLVAVGVAAVVVFFTATSGPRRASRDAPVVVVRPYLVRATTAGDDEVQFSPDDLEWHSPVHGVPFRLHFSWLACDLHGRHCSPLPGLSTQSIAPPQELRIVTLRGLVTATDRFGSRSARTTNFYYDMAGIPFDDSGFIRQHPQYDPAQLRAWYGLTPAEDGAGQTIVITAPWRVGSALGPAVRHFSAHYGLPRPCASQVERSRCFQLTVLRRQRTPDFSGSGEVDLDVEWAHAIAPDAAIDVLQAPAPEFLISRIARQENAHVFSSSWSWNRHMGLDEALFVFGQLGRGCGAAHVVCTWASGDNGHPGRSPANSPKVLAVGGTVFRSTPDGATIAENAWPNSGGGTTRLPEERPAWQSQLPCDPFNGDCTEREIPDVSATAKAVPKYDQDQLWRIGGGTSLASPLWAALIAIADQELAHDGQPAIGIDELHAVLYRGGLSAGLDDIHGRGWNAQTGLGSPKNGIVPTLVAAIEHYRANH